MPTWREVVKSVSEKAPKGTSLKDILPMASAEWKRLKATGKSLTKPAENVLRKVGKTRVGFKNVKKHRGFNTHKRNRGLFGRHSARRPFFRGGQAAQEASPAADQNQNGQVADKIDMDEHVANAQETTGEGNVNSVSNTVTPAGVPQASLIDGDSASGPEPVNEQSLKESFSMYGGGRRRGKRAGRKSAKKAKRGKRAGSRKSRKSRKH